MKRLFHLHPILFSVYPVLALFAHNVREVSLTDAARSLVVSVVVALLLTGLTWLAVRDWSKAGLICSVAIFLFFSYSSMYDLLKPAAIGGLVIFRYRVLIPLMLVLIGIWGWWVTRKTKAVGQLEVFFSLVGVISLIPPLYTIIFYHIRPVDTRFSTSEKPSPSLVEPQQGLQPDIYYIIVDAYGREDVLSTLYNYDNANFINYLKGQGFFVADDSYSNYPTTVLSLASSLNMQYLDSVAGIVGSDSEDLRSLEEMISHSQVRANLESLGYQMVAFETGWNYTSVKDADIYLQPEGKVQRPSYLSWSFNDFEGLLLRTTMVRVLFDINQSRIQNAQALASVGPFYSSFEQHRERILFTLSKLEEIPTWQGNYFVFAHVIIPHPPFVFGPNGEATVPSGAYTLQDGEGYPGSREEYIAGYRDQVAYLDKLLESTLTRIIQNSQIPPIIIIQGDHGPRAYFHNNSPEQTNMHESLSILNAYYFPGHKSALLYPSITPVNSFRMLFNLYFGGQYGLLKDESYFSTLSKPYDFINVTDRTRTDILTQ